MSTILEEKSVFPISIGNLLKQLDVEYESSSDIDGFTVSSIVGAENASVVDGCLFIPYSESDETIVKLCSNKNVVVLSDHFIDGILCIVVSDIINVLKSICDWMGSYINIPSIIVTGSEGKTTTKRMIYNVMNTEYKTFCKIGNYNTLHALCCQLQEIPTGPEYIVQEVDESRYNNILYCSQILNPEIAVITNIAEAHLGALGSKDALIKTFLDIGCGLKDDGIIIINADDETSWGLDFDKKVISVGIKNKNADYLASNIISTDKGKTEFDIIHDGQSEHITLPVLGEHNVYDAMVAFVIGKLKGISTKNIKQALLNYRNSGFRQNICSFAGTTVYADCYNASLRSVSFAVKTFDSLKAKRKVLVLGDIAELGEFAEDTYKGIADVINQTNNIDALITYGEDSAMINNYLTKDILSEHADTFSELDKKIRSMRLKGYNCWLFKASRTMKLEKNIKKAFPVIWRLYIGR